MITISYFCKSKPVNDSEITYRIYSRISHLAYKPTPIPAAKNLAKTSDLCISRYNKKFMRSHSIVLFCQWNDFSV